MATLSAPPTPNLNGGLMIDPTRPGEYPIMLGDKLAGRDGARDRQFVNVTYNYKTKGGTPQQKTTLSSTPSAPGTADRYRLTIQDRAGNAEQTSLTYVYTGGVDPEATASSKTENSNLVLIFDPKRKAFILEPVSTRLNFNLRSAPGKTDRQVAEQYRQLSTASSLAPEEASNGEDKDNESEDEDLGPADAENPFDYRHFLPKKKAERVSPDPHLAVSSNSNTNIHTSSTSSSSSRPVAPRSVPATAAATAKAKAKPKAKPAPKSKAQTNPLRTTKQRNTAAKKTENVEAQEPVPLALPPKQPEREPEPETIVESVETPDLVGVYSFSDDESKSRPAGSPGSNIIVDGDLIIEMGSPPPQRPAFKIDPTQFASNNSSANEAGYGSDDEDEVEDPYARGPQEDDDDDEPMEDVPAANPDEEEDFEDDLAAEMEAALEESAREEEEERARQAALQRQQQYHSHVPSDDESEVSEEE